MKKKFRLSIAQRLAVYFTLCLLIFSLIMGVAFTLLLYRNSRNNFILNMRQTATSISDMVSAMVNKNGVIIIGGTSEERPEMPDDSNQDGEGSFRPGGEIRINANVLGNFVGSLTNSTVWLIAPADNGTAAAAEEGSADTESENSSETAYEMMFLYRGESYTDTDFTHLGSDEQAQILKVFEGYEINTDGFSGVFGENTLTVGKPVINAEGNVIGAVLLHSAASGVYSALRRGMLIMAVSTLLALVLGVVGSFFISERFTEPLRKINNTAIMIAEGDYTARTNVHMSDEIGMLANTVDEMSAKLQSASEESERLQELRRNFVSNISHELRTPVTVMRGSLEALCDKVVTDEETVEQYHQELLKESIYMQRLVNDLLDLTRLQNPDFSMDIGQFNLYECLGDAVRSIRRVGDAKGVTVNFEYDTLELPYEGDYDRVRQMFVIVLDNAVKFTDDPANPVKVTLQAGKVSVDNIGQGISQEELPYIFDRFYRSRSEQNKNGTGLGLAIAKQIAVRHGIGISVSSVPGGVTEFSFDFGLVDTEPAKNA